MIAAIRAMLQQQAEEGYRRFQCKLMPTVDPATVLGVRTPALRLLAKEIALSPCAAAFLSDLPHDYYEENNLHAFLIEQIHDFSKTVAALHIFLPYINNWATCDSLSPRVFHSPAQREALLPPIYTWLASPHPYTVRFAINMLMRHYLDDAFSPTYPMAVAGVHRQEYYIRMMQAWYFATALAKQWDAVFPFFRAEKPPLPPWVHNKAIQKAIESRRISDEQKAVLRRCKIPTDESI